MSIQYRPATREEWSAFGNLVSLSHGDQPPGDEPSKKWWASFFNEVNTVAAFDEDELVGSALSFTRETSVPGGAKLPAALVTNVAVVPTHRRQGVLTRMLRDLLKSAYERGDAISTLWSSESPIYGRFGYGMAGRQYVAKIKSSNASLKHLPDVSGRVRMADRERIRDIGPDIWSRTSDHRPGIPERTAFGWYSAYSLSTEGWDSQEQYFFAVYEEDGCTDGYVVYSTSKTPNQDNNILLKELVGATEAAHAALWRFILSIDIVDEITDLYMSQDDPLWWMLGDPRALNLKPYDAIWLRILDVEKTLSARKYSAKCDLVFRVEDEYCQWIAGNYRMTVDDGGTAIVERTGATADITLTADALAICYFGNARFSELREAGRVQELTAGAIANADIAFHAERQPWCPLMY